MKREEISFPPEDLPLRDDVSAMGQLVGELIREQGGRALFERVEHARLAAIARRDGRADDGALLEACCFQDPREAHDFVKSFSTWFRMLNVVEQTHRIRRQRQQDAQGEASQAEGWEQILSSLREDGYSRDTLLALVSKLNINPVLTAHPTEASRRALLENEERIARLWIEGMNACLGEGERRALRDQLRMEASIAWQSAEHSHERPTVADEAEHVHYYLSKMLFRVAPLLHEKLEQAIERHFPADVTASLASSEVASINSKDSGSTTEPVRPTARAALSAPTAARVPTFLRFGSWVGGDMDGNPFVSGETVEATLREQRRVIIEAYREELSSLARRLTQSTEAVQPSEEFRAQLKAYGSLFPELSFAAQRQDMPLSHYCSLMDARLEATLRDEEQRAYPGPHAFRDDLLRLRGLLHPRAGRFPVERLLRRLEVFSFHLAALDLRVSSSDLHDAVALLLGCEAWQTLSVETRCVRLLEAIETGPLPSPVEHPVCSLLSAASRARARYGPDCIGALIVSMSHHPDDLLAAILASLACGLELGTVDVVPLFETIDDLAASQRVISELLALPLWRELLARRGQRQMIMLGYSDSSKDGGITASRWALFDAQRAMVGALQEQGIEPLFFHGRGGTIGRGGGKVHRAILASAPGSMLGKLRLTEQGEMIHRNYALSAIALRHLERMSAASLRASAEASVNARVAEQSAVLMSQIAARSREVYRSLVFAEGFYDYFREATPIDVIERLRIGSRPASRKAQRGIQDLRAIPWVFGWGQSRHGLPGWFGLGSALEGRMQEGAEAELRSLCRWPFFANLLSDVEMALAKSDMEIAEHYAALAGALGQRFFPAIRAEFERTRRSVCLLLQQEHLLEREPALKRTITLRSPYIDPMTYTQLALLPRWRAGARQDEALERVLVATVQGIARGLRNTG